MKLLSIASALAMSKEYPPSLTTQFAAPVDKFIEPTITSDSPDEEMLFPKVMELLNPPTKYKLDIFRASGDTYYSNLLYSTGPKEFNIKTRSKAKQMGYLLNQNGLFKESDKKKINLPQDDEKKILSYIKLQYLSPENRT